MFTRTHPSHHSVINGQRYKDQTKTITNMRPKMNRYFAHVCVRACVHVCVRACGRACMRAGVRACGRVCGPAGGPAYTGGVMTCAYVCLLSVRPEGKLSGAKWSLFLWEMFRRMLIIITTKKIVLPIFNLTIFGLRDLQLNCIVTPGPGRPISRKISKAPGHGSQRLNECPL